MNDALLNQMREVFSRFISDANELDTVFRGEPILEATSIDSMAMLHLVTDLEKEFGVQFSLETIDKTFESIDILATFLKENRGD
ncbi:phosphopantetheine-binding protein [Gammaproteobacteria bacterium]|nr:phosphopantetheine-binding protein [Gammaproteobacteria bacterium]